MIDRKFDIVVSNPPFQKTVNGQRFHAAANHWPEFVVKAEALTNTDGVFALITPNGWMTPSADVGKGKGGIRIYDYLRNYKTISINIDECGRHFKDYASSFTYFIIQKTEGTSDLTKIVTKDSEFNANITDVEYFPSMVNPISLSLNKKILRGKPIGFTNNNTAESLKFGKDITEVPSIDHGVKCYHSSAKTGTYVYSSYTSCAVSKKKVMVCSSGTFLPIYDQGVLGFTNKIYVYYLTNNENLNSIKSYLESKLIKAILSFNKTSGWTSYALRVLPKVDFTKNWTDEELYAHFNLTQEEIDLIEASV
jgi:hypothetical protein